MTKQLSIKRCRKCVQETCGRRSHCGCSQCSSLGTPCTALIQRRAAQRRLREATSRVNVRSVRRRRHVCSEMSSTVSPCPPAASLPPDCVLPKRRVSFAPDTVFKYSGTRHYSSQYRGRCFMNRLQVKFRGRYLTRSASAALVSNC